MNTTLQIRIDMKSKKAAQKTLESLGLDISSATKIFLKKVVATNSIPFAIKTENGFTESEELELIKEVKQAKRIAKQFKTAQSALSSIK